MKEQIHICTLDEANYIEDTLKSLEGQGETIVLDSDSDDGTRDIARSYADEVVNVPRGKLNARIYGVENYDADIILCADAGDIYPSWWADEITRPFYEDDNVVATQGPCYPQKWMWHIRLFANNTYKRFTNLQGNNSAFKTEAFDRVGGFNTDINQQNRVQMFYEEEMKLRRKMQKIGDVKFVPEAYVYKSQRHMPFGPETDRGYIQQVLNGDRF